MTNPERLLRAAPRSRSSSAIAGMRQAFTLLAGAVWLACAQLEPPPIALPAPPAGMATLVVVHDGYGTGRIVETVVVDRRSGVELPRDGGLFSSSCSYTAIDVPAGTRSLAVGSGAGLKPIGMPIEVATGETKFVVVTTGEEFLETPTGDGLAVTSRQWHHAIAAVDAETGARAAGRCVRVDP